MIDPPLIVITGLTASGKTDLAVSLAELINGEIICADSRTVYKGLDIGTAKPSKLARRNIPHFALDLVEPDERFTLYDFQLYARTKINEIRERGKVPILVGGSGLYVDSIIYSYKLRADNFKLSQRRELEALTINDLLLKIKSAGIKLPKDTKNKRRLIRAIERNDKVNNIEEFELIDNTLVWGINVPRDQLRKRIEFRAQLMVKQGIVEETHTLTKRYGVVEPLKRNAYGAALKLINNEINEDQLIKNIAQLDWHLARKQATWWRNRKRRKHIYWQTNDDFYKKITQLKKLSPKNRRLELAKWLSEYKNNTNLDS